jgi:hypothetical protein
MGRPAAGLQPLRRPSHSSEEEARLTVADHDVVLSKGPNPPDELVDPSLGVLAPQRPPKPPDDIVVVTVALRAYQSVPADPGSGRFETALPPET